MIEDDGWPPFHEFPIQPRHVEIFDGVSRFASTGTGELDIGIYGIQISSPNSSADADFQVSFTAQELALPGEVTLDFGVEGSLGAKAIVERVRCCPSTTPRGR